FPVKFQEFTSNRGRSITANTGMNLASGKYLCFLDDDDIFYPYHISTLVDHLENNSVKVAYTDAVRATQAPAPYSKDEYLTCDTALVYSEPMSLKKLIVEDGNHLPILCVMFEKSCLEKGLCFDHSLDVLEDWDFWIQLAKEFEFHHIPMITAEYRIRLDGSNTVGQFDHIWEYARETIRNRYLDLRKSLGVTWNQRLA
ncbi:MAG: glycosyltransferase, partial [Bdellovibrionales bacterium]|nr:glycosyltransferase [Bdellovibrionales bacterium]